MSRNDSAFCVGCEQPGERQGRVRQLRPCLSENERAAHQLVCNGNGPLRVPSRRSCLRGIDSLRRRRTVTWRPAQRA